MYTAKLDKFYIGDNLRAELKFYGKNAKILNDLEHLTTFYKSRKNDYIISLLQEQKKQLNQEINNLNNKIAEIKKQNRFYAFNKELRNEVYNVNNTIDDLTSQICNINLRIEKLDNSRYYDYYKSLVKYDELLNMLGFYLSSETRDKHNITQMYTFDGNEEDMLKKAEQMFEGLELSLKMARRRIKREYEQNITEDEGWDYWTN